MAKPKKKSAPPAPPVSARAKKATPAPAAATRAPRATPAAAKPAKRPTARAVAPTPAPSKARAKPAAKQATTKAENDTIHTWHGLQEALRAAPNADAVQEIKNAEIAGPARLRWLLRIQGRLQILRNEEEVEFLTSIARS